jgi:aspartate aminotransferase-like enzyme
MKTLPKTGDTLKLFSPGPVPSKYSTELLFSHRSSEFEQLFAETRQRLLNLAGYQNVVFTQGSASSAIETVLSSILVSDSKLLILVNGEFARRAAKMASFYTRHVKEVNSLESLLSALENQSFDYCFVVQFETSLSIFNELKKIEALCLLRNVHLIADVVSAFPYYEPPRAKFLITSSSKQLRGLPAMGLIFYDQISDLTMVERSNYLNLAKYIDYANKNQTPHTSLIPQFDSLNQALAGLNLKALRANISRNALTLTEGLEDHVVNERVCPVVTLKVRDADSIVEKLRLEGISVYHNRYYMDYFIQIGCFNYESQEVYTDLNQLLRSIGSTMWHKGA